MTRPASALPTHLDEHLTEHITRCREYLRSEDKATRLLALRAIGECVDTLIIQEYIVPPRKAKARPARTITRLLARIRRLA